MLSNDLSNRIYVGRSSTGMYRPRNHIYSNPRTPVRRWVDKYASMGLMYQITVLETFDTSDSLNDAERFYIAYFKSIGMPLLNCTDGGEGVNGFRHSQATRKKMSEAQSKRSPETCKKLADANRGRPLAPEHVRKLVVARRNRPGHSVETREKMSVARKGVKVSAETRVNMSKAQKAIVPLYQNERVEILKKAREVLASKPVSIETREKHRTSMVGNQHARKHQETLEERRVRNNKRRLADHHAKKKMQLVLNTKPGEV
jgi:hypothetical protein